MKILATALTDLSPSCLQVLFEAFRETTVLQRGLQYTTQEILIESDHLPSRPPGSAGSYIMPARVDPPIYQVAGRSWNAARHIISSAGATGHGDLWDAWGSTTEERQLKEAKREAMQQDLRRELMRKDISLEPTSSWTLEPLLMDSQMVFEVDMTPEEAQKCVQCRPACP